MIDELDRKIIAVLQSDFPLVAEPYRELAGQIGITQAELLAKLEKYLQTGAMRRLGVVIRHQEAGYVANALCIWRVPTDRLEKVAALLSAEPGVTHCYERATQPGWPYNIYSMIHGHSKKECEKTAAQIADAAGIADYKLLFSTREWKKSSMRYFGE